MGWSGKADWIPERGAESVVGPQSHYLLVYLLGLWHQESFIKFGCLTLETEQLGVGWLKSHKSHYTLSFNCVKISE